MYLLDDEGELSTVEVSAKFVNGKPDRIEAKYIMKSKFEWDRFMRFMERYSDEKGLGFTKKKVDGPLLYGLSSISLSIFECVSCFVVLRSAYQPPKRVFAYCLYQRGIMV